MLIKVCGLTNQADIRQLSRLSVDLCGFILHPKSPRFIAPEQARNMQTGQMKRTGVIVNHSGMDIARLIRTARLDFIQFHGAQTKQDALIAGVRKVIRVLWPQKYTSLDELMQEAGEWKDFCAFYLLDSGKRGGGSGKTINWSDLSGLCLPHPWLLAGGLREANAPAAIAACSPDGIDLNSGVETTPGIKDCNAVARIIESIK